MPHDQTSWTILARLLRPQGRKGELLAELHTDFPERFKPGATFFLAPPGFAGTASDASPVELVSSWLPHGRNAGRIVLGFSGTETIAAAERLAGLEVIVPETERLELGDGGVYIDDLIGCTVYDGGLPVGTVGDVQFMTTADGKRRLTDATPLLTVDMDLGEALIPFAQEFIVDLDLAGKRILMNLPRGLVDLNLRPAKPTRSETESQSD